MVVAVVVVVVVVVVGRGEAENEKEERMLNGISKRSGDGQTLKGTPCNQQSLTGGTGFRKAVMRMQVWRVKSVGYGPGGVVDGA